MDKIADILSKLINPKQGQSLTFGGAGSRVRVRVGNQTVSAIACSDINSSPVTIFEGEDGQRYAYCGSASRQVSEKITKLMRSQHGKQSPVYFSQQYLIKFILEVNNTDTDKYEYWLYGDRKEAIKLLEMDNNRGSYGSSGISLTNISQKDYIFQNIANIGSGNYRIYTITPDVNYSQSDTRFDPTYEASLLGWGFISHTNEMHYVGDNFNTNTSSSVNNVISTTSGSGLTIYLPSDWVNSGITYHEPLTTIKLNQFSNDNTEPRLQDCDYDGNIALFNDFATNFDFVGTIESIPNASGFDINTEVGFTPPIASFFTDHGSLSGGFPTNILKTFVQTQTGTKQYYPHWTYNDYKYLGFENTTNAKRSDVNATTEQLKFTVGIEKISSIKNGGFLYNGLTNVITNDFITGNFSQSLMGFLAKTIANPGGIYNSKSIQSIQVEFNGSINFKGIDVVTSIDYRNNYYQTDNNGSASVWVNDLLVNTDMRFIKKSGRSSFIEEKIMANYLGTAGVFARVDADFTYVLHTPTGDISIPNNGTDFSYLVNMGTSIQGGIYLANSRARLKFNHEYQTLFDDIMTSVPAMVKDGSDVTFDVYTFSEGAIAKSQVKSKTYPVVLPPEYYTGETIKYANSVIAASARLK